MAERMFGVETEYGFAVLSAADSESTSKVALGRLMELARSRLTHLPGANDAGLFLSNGARLYIDVGNHPEYCTPECTHPSEVVRYVKAGDRLLHDLAERLGSQASGGPVLLFRGNVDYGGSGSTWGCHESYAHRVRSGSLARELIPHLVSRIVFSGGGGFNPKSPGIEFTLSPRIWHLERTISSHSTRHRGIFHDKEESLSGHGYRRLHVLCGESLCCETGLWLTIASTALVVALIEAGETPGAGVALSQPLDALRRFASDPSLRAGAGAASGNRPLTALRIQRHYLSEVESRLQADFMPPWAEEACRRWRATLDGLERGSGALARTLDWPIKLELYRQHVHRRGLDLLRLAFWNSILRKLQSAVTASGIQKPLSLREALGADSPIREEVQNLEPALRARGLCWNDIEPYRALRRELFEIDTRYAQLGRGGIFDGLDSAGVLDHRIPGVGDHAQAMKEPPEAGRGRLRGEAIQRLAADGRARCDWDAVWDPEYSSSLDLSDPFERVQRWVQWDERPPRGAVRTGARLHESIVSRLRMLRAEEHER